MRRFYLEYLLITIRNEFFMKLNSNIFANFTSNICSLHLHFCKKYFEYLLITSSCLHILPRIFDHYIMLKFSRRYSYFFRNENDKIMCEDFTSNIFFMKINTLFSKDLLCKNVTKSCQFILWRFGRINRNLEVETETFLSSISSTFLPLIDRNFLTHKQDNLHKLHYDEIRTFGVSLK